MSLISALQPVLQSVFDWAGVQSGKSCLNIQSLPTCCETFGTGITCCLQCTATAVMSRATATSTTWLYKRRAAHDGSVNVMADLSTSNQVAQITEQEGDNSQKLSHRLCWPPQLICAVTHKHMHDHASLKLLPWQARQVQTAHADTVPFPTQPACLTSQTPTHSSAANMHSPCGIHLQSQRLNYAFEHGRS